MKMNQQIITKKNDQRPKWLNSKQIQEIIDDGKWTLNIWCKSKLINTDNKH